MRLLVSRMFQRTILAWSVLEDRTDLLGRALGFLALGRREMRLHLGLDGVDGGVARLLVGVLVGVAQFVFDEPSISLSSAE